MARATTVSGNVEIRRGSTAPVAPTPKPPGVPAGYGLDLPDAQAKNLTRIKLNVAKMVDQGAPASDIDAYIAAEGETLDHIRNWHGRPGEVIFPSDTTKAMDRDMTEALQMKPRSDGPVMNLSAGLNDAIYKGLGYPIDASRNLINWGVAGVNALNGAPLTQNMIPDTNVGGSRWINQQFQGIGVRDPAAVQAGNETDRLMRAAGEGVGMTVLPEMGVAALGPKLASVAPYAEAVFGPGKTVRGMAGNAFAGATAGLGAQAGADMAPENLKPLAATIGGVVGGVGGALATGIPRAAGAGAKALGDYIAPLSAKGQQRAAAGRMADSASNPSGFVRALDNLPPENIAGSSPTTFQATGDMGIGGLERAAQTRNPAAFQGRRAEQNTARVAALSGLEGAGSPSAVVDAVRTRLSDIERAADSAVTSATSKARSSADALGPGKTPDVAGEGLRNSLEAARASAKQSERTLWDAVDPHGTLNLGTTSTKAEATKLKSEIPASARPAEGEEAAIYAALDNYRDVMPLREVTALQSRLKTAMREEKFARGESPAWRRLAMLNKAIERDLDNAIADKATTDAAAVSAGKIAPEDTISSRLSQLAGSGEAPRSGSAVFTPSGARHDVNYTVMEADQVIPSNLSDMRPNPAYPQWLQPRNRDRMASDVQVSQMAGNLQPERLGTSASAAEGAPIVGPDMLVESGNARTIAIQRAYDQGKAEAYRRYLQSQGFDVAGMRRPMLVRVRQGNLDQAGRQRFAQEANASPVLSMAASERAASDASRLGSDVLGLYRGGDLASPANRDFVRGFLSSVANKGEEGAFTTRDGGLSLEGGQRIASALLQKAYGNTQLIEALADAGDENVQAFGRALGDVAGDVARLKQAIADGRVNPQADISPSMVEAAQFVWGARKRGVTLANAVAQMDAFSPLSADAFKVLQAGYGEGLVGRLSRERFEAIAKSAISEAEQQTTEARLFGEPMGASDILNGAVARYGRQNPTASSFSAGPEPLGSGYGASGNAGGGFVPRAPGSGSAAAGGPILERPALTPNLDSAAVARLKAAQQSTRQRAETFDNKTLAPIRRRSMASGPYDMAAGAVPGRIFAPGPKSYEAVLSYRKAVGDDAALRDLEDYAIDRLRRVALKEDGTFDPIKVEAFRRNHADALRAFPELDRRLSDAGQLSQKGLELAKAKRREVEDAKIGVVGRIAGVGDPGDVVRTVGSLFGRNDAVSQMELLRDALKGHRDGEAGLKTAIAQHIAEKFVSNTEAGTSGQGTIKADQFQSFVRRNRPVLAAAGFTPKEIDVMARVAADLKQANRSLSSVRIPGQSNTAQDVFAARVFDAPTSMLKGLAASVIGGVPIAAVLNPFMGAGFAIGGAIASIMRQRGLTAIDELVEQALLDPAFARMLLKKYPPSAFKRPRQSIAGRAVKAAAVGPLVPRLPGVPQAPDHRRSERGDMAVAARRRAQMLGVL